MWINTTTGFECSTHSEIRASRKGSSIPRILTPEIITSLGFVELIDLRPDFDKTTQYINKLASVEVDGVWTTQWEVIDLDEETTSANKAKQKVEKLAALAAYRYEKETGGLTLPNGMQVATDDRSKTLIVGARVNTVDNPELLTDWKAETGWVQIDAATVAYIATAIADHVRACFTVEKGHYEAIDALTDHLDVDAYDFTTGWPV